ncbi:MAG: glycine--tRNA ligase subunit beta, partial [Dokdonella sp.]
ATRAAALAKCDLVTRMVGEFPELQGVMGRIYASQGEKPEAPNVAAALDEFYQPRFAGDAIAAGKVGQVLAIAERIDTLVGIFAVGMKPSGNKDPFALRRAALGLARTLIEGEFDLDLHAQLLEASESVLAAVPTESESKASKPRPIVSELADDVFSFVLDRMRGYFADQGIGSETFDAVRATHPHSLLDFDRRIHAVHEFAALPDAKALAAANKRIGNILRQSNDAAGKRVDPTLLEAGAETTLANELERIAGDAARRIQSRDYVGLLRLLAGLREPVDAYFDAVMVMADDPALRANRLALLGRLRNLFLHVADISMLPNS